MSTKRSEWKMPAGQESMLPQSVLFGLLNRLPTTTNALTWIVQYRESLMVLFPEVSHITINANLSCDLANPTEDKGDLSVVEHRTGSVNGSSKVTVTAIEPDQCASERLLADFKAKGYPLEQFHDPASFDYYFQGVAYIGSIFLWADRAGSQLSSSTLDGFRSIEPFIIFALTDLIARSQIAQPFDRAYNFALQRMANEAQLSPQERKVIVLRLYGHDYNDVADRLNLSLETVRKHIQSIHRKTGTRSIAELFAKYFTPRIGF